MWPKKWQKDKKYQPGPVTPLLQTHHFPSGEKSRLYYFCLQGFPQKALPIPPTLPPRLPSSPLRHHVLLVIRAHYALSLASGPLHVLLLPWEDLCSPLYSGYCSAVTSSERPCLTSLPKRATLSVPLFSLILLILKQGNKRKQLLVAICILICLLVWNFFFSWLYL